MSEEDLGERLRALLASSDLVPPDALQAAYEAIGWRDPDAALAQLVAEPEPDLTRLRGRQPRLLTFRSNGIVVDLEVSAEDGTARLLGQLDPPQPAEITIESPGGSRSTQADSQGRFAAENLPAGWLRVLIGVGAADRHRTATEWFRA